MRISGIVRLNEAAARDIAVAGGKAARVARLASEFDVPAGFVVTGDLLGDRVLPVAERARLRERLAPYLLELGAGGVAVRSSALDEDGGSASFAGQYLTLLNVEGEDAVIDAIEAVFASATSERVESYRSTDGGAVTTRFAVLVQHCLHADLAGVAFTRNPASGAREIVLDASYGLGEGVVSGTVSPDSYRLTYELEIVERSLGEKLTMTVPWDTGVREVQVPRALRDTLAATDAQVCAIASLACRVREVEGFDVDIEFAFEGDRLFLLQSRPITTHRSAE